MAYMPEQLQIIINRLVKESRPIFGGITSKQKTPGYNWLIESADKGLAYGLAFFFCGVSENPLVFDIPIP